MDPDLGRGQAEAFEIDEGPSARLLFRESFPSQNEKTRSSRALQPQRPPTQRYAAAVPASTTDKAMPKETCRSSHLRFLLPCSAKSKWPAMMIVALVCPGSVQIIFAQRLLICCSVAAHPALAKRSFTAFWRRLAGTRPAFSRSSTVLRPTKRTCSVAAKHVTDVIANVAATAVKFRRASTELECRRLAVLSRVRRLGRLGPCAPQGNWRGIDLTEGLGRFVRRPELQRGIGVSL